MCVKTAKVFSRLSGVINQELRTKSKCDIKYIFNLKYMLF